MRCTLEHSRRSKLKNNPNRHSVWPKKHKHRRPKIVWRIKVFIKFECTAVYGIIQLIRNTYAHSQGLSDRSIALDLSNSHNSIVTSHFLMQAKKNQTTGWVETKRTIKTEHQYPEFPRVVDFSRSLVTWCCSLVQCPWVFYILPNENTFDFYICFGKHGVFSRRIGCE